MHFHTINTLADIYDPGNEEDFRQQFGGKCLNLIVLHKNCFPVPAGFVVPTSAFEAIMLEALRNCPDKPLGEIIADLQFPADFVDAFKEALSALGGRTWAVRSSSTDEDSNAHSFAGLQESIVDVSSPEACLDAIKRVWQSFYSKERMLYPSQANLSAPVPSMAVIVQKYIRADAAGVVFTRHPFQGQSALLINVSKGQCSNVVNGKAAESLCIYKQNIYAIDDSVAIESTCLTTRELLELGQIACQIEDSFNHPQDIEFAFSKGNLHILQSRDIVLGEQKNEKTLYSNINVGEALSGAATPMTWSVGMTIAERGFNTVFSTFGLTTPPNYTFVTTFYGHIYINISEVMSVASQVPFFRKDLFAHILGLQSLDDYQCTIDTIPRSYFIKHLPLSIARIARMQMRLNRLPERAKKFKQERDRLLECNLTFASVEEILQTFSRLNDLFFDCAYDMLGAGGTFLACYLCFSDFISRFSDETQPSLEPSLFSGLNEVQSAAPGFELLELANWIRKYPELTQCFLNEESFTSIESFKTRLESVPQGPEFIARFEQFLERHGARAHQEAELANPRWREDPSFLFKVLRSHLRTTRGHAAQTIVNSVVTHRETRENDFAHVITRSLRPMFRMLFNAARKTARLREEWRAYVVDVLGLFRKFFLEVAIRLVNQNILSRPDDIFFLTYQELLEGLKTPSKIWDARLRVSFRRARHQAYTQACTLPDTFVTHPNTCPDSSHQPLKSLRGLPASPGCVRARVRVVHSIDEASALEYGEILVTTTTDVAWTPLFLIASAILTERGGPLSHAFVVAREYGIPAVVSINGLLDTLKTGDIVTVSGEKGAVYLE